MINQKDMCDFIINEKYEFWNGETKAFQKEPIACFGPSELSDVIKTKIKYLWIGTDFPYKERVVNLIKKHYKFNFKESVICIGSKNIKDFKE